MLGAIIGDVVGSVFEFNNFRSKKFLFFQDNAFFTDDTVMTCAVANAIMKCKNKYTNLDLETIKQMQNFGKKYPCSHNISYGARFNSWLTSKKPQPYNSCGNGSAMRISAVPYFSKSEDELKELVYKVTAITHNHEEGIKGAEATAICIFMALNGYSKEDIKQRIEKEYYSLDFDYNDLVKNYQFNEICQTTVPQAIYCFLISSDFEDAIRTGISIGGDSDTLCAIIGAIAEAYYGIPDELKEKVYEYLDKTIIKCLNNFNKLKTNNKNN